MALEELTQEEKISPIFRKRHLQSRFKKAYPERAEENLEFGVTEAKHGWSIVRRSEPFCVHCCREVKSSVAIMASTGLGKVKVL